MVNESKKPENDQNSMGDEISQDALGDTHLGKNLGHLIREIGRQHKQVLEGAAGESPEGGMRESDTADRMERLNEALEGVDSDDDYVKTIPIVDRSKAEELAGQSKEVQPEVGAGKAQSDTTDSFSKALSAIEQALREFAEAERRQHEKDIASWKAQFKKAAMIVVKKQVEAAKANWSKRSSANEAKVAEHYKKLKVLADKVARQKVEIQRAKQELKEKLELADRLHVEFDSIRQVLDGKIGILEDLDKEDDKA